MKTEQIIILIVSFFLGMLLLNMVKNVCGCELKEGFEYQGTFSGQEVAGQDGNTILGCNQFLNTLTEGPGGYGLCQTALRGSYCDYANQGEGGNDRLVDSDGNEVCPNGWWNMANFAEQDLEEYCAEVNTWEDFKSQANQSLQGSDEACPAAASGEGKPPEPEPKPSFHAACPGGTTYTAAVGDDGNVPCYDWLMHEQTTGCGPGRFPLGADVLGGVCEGIRDAPASGEDWGHAFYSGGFVGVVSRTADAVAFKRDCCVPARDILRGMNDPAAVAPAPSTDRPSAATAGGVNPSSSAADRCGYYNEQSNCEVAKDDNDHGCQWTPQERSGTDGECHSRGGGSDGGH